MKKAEEQYRDKGLKVIWMGFQDKKEKIMDFMTKHGVRASVGYDNRDIISKKYGIKYGAGLIVINSEGIVKKRVPKGFSEKTLFEAVEYTVKNKDMQEGKK